MSDCSVAASMVPESVPTNEAVVLNGLDLDQTEANPRLIVFASLFPNSGQPTAGLFIRERMFRVGAELPLMVVSPKPWFPFQGLLRRFKPGYRPKAPVRENQDGVEAYYPRFLALPLIGRGLDGLSMAVCCLPLMRRLKRKFGFQIIDAHFAYPDGYAATLLARWLGVKSTITLRGTEVPLSKSRVRRALMCKALSRAERVFSVADSLKRHVASLGADAEKIRVVGNGVDVQRFSPVSKADARRRFEIPDSAQVLITVGGLVPRKGFHRVIECLPDLLQRYRQLHYLVVGGASPEGDNRAELQALAQRLGVEDRVHFLGPIAPDDLKWPLSAADVFVLATSNEGWANVILEAMACGLPVVTTDVGGNREVVDDPSLGMVVPFGDRCALSDALSRAMSQRWDSAHIVAHARDNSWDTRVDVLVDEFRSLNRNTPMEKGRSA